MSTPMWGLAVAALAGIAAAAGVAAAGRSETIPTGAPVVADGCQAAGVQGGGGVVECDGVLDNSLNGVSVHILSSGGSGPGTGV